MQRPYILAISRIRFNLDTIGTRARRGALEPGQSGEEIDQFLITRLKNASRGNPFDLGCARWYGGYRSVPLGTAGRSLLCTVSCRSQHFLLQIVHRLNVVVLLH